MDTKKITVGGVYTDLTSTFGLEGKVKIQNRNNDLGVELFEVEAGGTPPTNEKSGYLLTKNNNIYFYDVDSGYTLYGRSLGGKSGELIAYPNHEGAISSGGGGGGGSSIDYTGILSAIKLAVQGINTDTDNLAPILTAISDLEGQIHGGNLTLTDLLTKLTEIGTMCNAISDNTDELETILKIQRDSLSSIALYVDDVESNILKVETAINNMKTSMDAKLTSINQHTLNMDDNVLASHYLLADMKPAVVDSIGDNIRPIRDAVESIKNGQFTPELLKSTYANMETLLTDIKDKIGAGGSSPELQTLIDLSDQIKILLTSIDTKTITIQELKDSYVDMDRYLSKLIPISISSDSMVTSLNSLTTLVTSIEGKVGAGGGSSIDYTTLLTEIKTVLGEVNTDLDKLTSVNQHLSNIANDTNVNSSFLAELKTSVINEITPNILPIKQSLDTIKTNQLTAITLKTTLSHIEALLNSIEGNTGLGGIDYTGILEDIKTTTQSIDIAMNTLSELSNKLTEISGKLTTNNDFISEIRDYVVDEISPNILPIKQAVESINTNQLTPINMKTTLGDVETLLTSIEGKIGTGGGGSTDLTGITTLLNEIKAKLFTAIELKTSYSDMESYLSNIQDHITGTDYTPTLTDIKTLVSEIKTHLIGTDLSVYLDDVETLLGDLKTQGITEDKLKTSYSAIETSLSDILTTLVGMNYKTSIDNVDKNTFEIKGNVSNIELNTNDMKTYLDTIQQNTTNKVSYTHLSETGDVTDFNPNDNTSVPTRKLTSVDIEVMSTTATVTDLETSSTVTLSMGQHLIYGNGSSIINLNNIRLTGKFRLVWEERDI